MRQAVKSRAPIERRSKAPATLLRCAQLFENKVTTRHTTSGDERKTAGSRAHPAPLPLPRPAAAPEAVPRGLPRPRPLADAPPPLAALLLTAPVSSTSSSLPAPCAARPLPLAAPAGGGASMPLSALHSSTKLRSSASSPSFRRASSSTSAVLICRRPACAANASRSRAVLAMCV